MLLVHFPLDFLKLNLQLGTKQIHGPCTLVATCSANQRTLVATVGCTCEETLWLGVRR